MTLITVGPAFKPAAWRAGFSPRRFLGWSRHSACKPIFGVEQAFSLQADFVEQASACKPIFKSAF
jgi:hypothetical protein